MNGSFSSHLDCAGSVSAAPSVMSVASTVCSIDPHRSRSRLMDSSDDSTSALISNKRSQSRDELIRSTSRSISRCRNPSLNWSSTEGSVETMSVAISDLTEPHGTLPSPDHLVNRKDLLEKMGINPGASKKYQHQR